jgi:hypothetical protein
MWLIEHVIWNDGTETTQLVPDEGQGAHDNPTDAIASVWYEKTNILCCNPELAAKVEKNNKPTGSCWGWGEEDY